VLLAPSGAIVLRALIHPLLAQSTVMNLACFTEDMVVVTNLLESQAVFIYQNQVNEINYRSIWYVKVTKMAKLYLEIWLVAIRAWMCSG
jgi:hypothetical protein